MKKIITLALTGLALLLTSNTFAQVGFGTNQPDKSAAVEILSNNRGLLIPRIDIPALNSATPVTNPATSLFVYNTNTTTGEGFYFWDGTKWVKFVSGNNEKTVTVTAGNNVDVTTTPNGNETKYTVSVESGGTDGYVLVTEKTAPGVFTTTWIDPQTFIEDVKASNGLTFDAATSTVELGGTLDKATTIKTTSTETLAITGLTDVVTPSTEKVMIMNASGILQTTDISDLVNANAKDLTTGTALEITGTGTGAVLQAVEIGIADKGVKAVKLSSDDGLGGNAASGTVAMADGAGNVTYEAITADDLTSTKNIDLETALEFTNSTDGTGAVLKAVQIGIADQGVTTAKIAPSATFDQVLTTDAAGSVTWADNKTVSLVNGTNTTVSSNIPSGNNTAWQVDVATANGTALGVVKESATAPMVNINASGELSVNLTNTTLAGDVTGSLDATTVEKIQGTSVANTVPTTDQVLLYNNALRQWEPTTLDGSAITGGALTSTSLAIPANTAVLEDLAIEIKPGAVGTILTTTDDGTGLVTTWENPNSLVKVNNGLNYDSTDDKIQMGGLLTEATEITTTSTETLAITGLQAATTANSIVVVDNTTDPTQGVLRTIERSITSSTTASLAITSIADYSSYVLKVTVLVDIPATSNVDITLPTASTDNKGQVINIKVEQSNGDHYVNIIDGSTTITYGALPYQGWTLTSNGTKWVIIGRY